MTSQEPHDFEDVVDPASGRAGPRDFSQPHYASAEGAPRYRRRSLIPNEGEYQDFNENRPAPANMMPHQAPASDGDPSLYSSFGLTDVTGKTLRAFTGGPFSDDHRRKSTLARCFSVRGLFLSIVLLLTAGTFVAGLAGFAFFLRSSFLSSQETRTIHVSLLVEKIAKLMQTPKVITDALSATISSGAVNFTTTSLADLSRFVIRALDQNFLLSGMTSMIMWVANSDANRFVAYWATLDADDGTPRYTLNRRHDSVDNTTIDQIYFCGPVDIETGGCLDPQNATYEIWDRYASITWTSRFYPTPQFVPPYSFYCPGPLCDVFFGYVHPQYGSDGKYVAGCGVVFPGNALTFVLQTADGVELGDVTFFVDLKTDRMVSTSLGHGLDIILDADDGTFYSAMEHMHPLVGPFMRYVNVLEGGNITRNLPPGVYRQATFRWKYIDYVRYQAYGSDWLFVHHSNVLRFIGSSLLYAAVFVFSTSFAALVTVCCGLWGGRLVSAPLRSLGGEMGKVKSMNLSEVVIGGKRLVEGRMDAPRPSLLSRLFSCEQEVGWSRLWEVAELQKQFCFLVDKLALYRSFLPTHLKEEEIEAGGGMSTLETDQENLERSLTAGSYGGVVDPSAMMMPSFQANASALERPLDEPSSSDETECVSIAPPKDFFSSGFSQVLQENVITLCHIRWAQVFGVDGFRLSGREFVEHHTRASSVVAETLSRYRGVFVDMSYDHFVIGFNVLSHLRRRRDATTVAASFLLEVLGRLNFRVGGPFETTAAICTGACFSGVLGCSLQKGLVVRGVVRERVEEMANYAARLGVRALVDSPTFARLNPSRFHFEAVDLCLFKSLDVSVVYSIRKMPAPRSQEWMYVVNFEAGVRDQIRLLRVWGLFQASKPEECLEEMRSLKEAPEEPVEIASTFEKNRRLKCLDALERSCLQMISRKMTFLEWAKEMSRPRVRGFRLSDHVSLLFERQDALMDDADQDLVEVTRENSPRKKDGARGRD